MSARSSRQRRERSATESLVSIALALEAFLVFFAALTAFGLRAVEPVVALVGGGVLMVLIILAAGALPRAWAFGLAWALQLALILSGIIVPLMFLLGAAFAALFIFCFVRGRQLDTQKAAYLAAQTKENNS